MIQFVNLIAFYFFESSHTFQHLIEVYLVCIEFRPVHANEFCLSADSNSASTTHTCSVHHNCIKRNICGYVIFLRQQRYEFHHDSRADAETFIYFLTFNDFFNTFGYKAFFSVRTVIRHNDYFVRTFAHFLFKDDKFFGTTCKHGDNPVAGSFQSLYYREERGNAYTASCTYYRSKIFDVSSLPERSYYVRDIITRFQLAKFGRR